MPSEQATSPAQKTTRPWWQLHVVTIMATLAVAAGLAYAELTAEPDGKLGSVYFHIFGWPNIYLVVGMEGRAVYEQHFRLAGLLFDVAVSCGVLFISAWTVERWLRRKRAWLPLLAVIASLVYANTCDRFDIVGGPFIVIDTDNGNSVEHGWPGTFLKNTLITSELNHRYVSMWQREWSIGMLATDCVVATVLIAATWFASQLWQRRRLRWWQFSLSSLLLLPCVIAFMAPVYYAGIHAEFSKQIEWDDGHWNGLPCWVIAPLLLGIGCAVYTLGWLVWHAMARFLNRRKHLSNSKDELHVASS